MSWDLKKNLKSIVSGESGAVIKNWGGKASIALVYPNTYRLGMGNLAVHTLYKLLNSRQDSVCERFFLPTREEAMEYVRTGTPLLSMESQRPLCDFDIAAFSISFENDYLNIFPIFDMSRIPHRASERGDGHPVLIAGGVAPTLNPRPIMGIFDAVARGEAEMFLDDLIPALCSRAPRREIISALGKMDGVFTASSPKSPDHPAPRRLENLSAWPTQTVIHCKDAEFSNMHLIEIERGCPYQCKFCATPAIYGKARHRGAPEIIQMVEEGLKYRKKMGLIGAYILSHPNFLEVASAIHKKGAEFSPSSIRAGEIDEKKARLLHDSGHRSVALGIEAGSEGLRDKLGKGISDAQIIEAISILASSQITRLKLYFMIGLPGETQADIESIVSLSGRARTAIERHAPKISRQTSVDLTFQAFVPKPGTPFEKAEFAGIEALKQKIAFLKKMIGRKSGIGAHFDPPRESAIEAFLSRADETAIEFLEADEKDRRAFLQIW